MISRRAFLLSTSGAVGLAGCLPGAGPPADLYALTPKSTFRPDLPVVGWQLVVEEPVAANGLNTAYIAIRPGPTEIDYVPRARWAERAPAMVQTLLVESFENSGRIVSVGRQAIGLRADYLLKSELRKFEIETQEGRPVANVRLILKLVHQPKRTIVASTSIQYVIAAEGKGALRDIVTAFDEALGKTMRRVVEWTITSAKPAA